MMEIYKSFYNVFGGKKLDPNFLVLKDTTLYYKKNHCILLQKYFNYSCMSEYMKLFTIDVKTVHNNPMFNICVTVFLNIETLKKELGKTYFKSSIIFKFLENNVVSTNDDSTNIMNDIMQNPVEYIDSHFKVTPPMNVTPYIYQKENIKWMLDIENNIARTPKEFKKNHITYDNICFDIKNKIIYHKKNSQKYTFYGGVLADQVGTGKCLVPDTNIHFLNGDITTIKDIFDKYSDKVNTYFDGEGTWYNLKEKLETISFDPDSNTLKPGTISKIYRQYVDTNLKKITLSNGTTITCTYKHKFYAYSKYMPDVPIWLESHVLHVDDKLHYLDDDVSLPLIVDITDVKYEGYVYDIEVQDYHNYISNGILTHNTLCCLTTSLMNSVPKILDVKKPEFKYEDKDGNPICRSILSSGKNKGNMCGKKANKDKIYCSVHAKSVSKTEYKPKFDYSKIPNLKDTIFCKKDDKYTNIKTRATLVISPNQLCEQWKHEVESLFKKDYKVYVITTKTHFEKLKYDDIINADFVIISFNMMINKCLTDKMFNYKVRRFSTPKDRLELLINNKLKDINILNETGPIFHMFYWQRIIIDEFHELSLYDYDLFKNIKLLKSKYKWIASGTPFTNGTVSYNNIIEFICNKFVDDNGNVHKFISNKLFRRNTKESIKREYVLPPLLEENRWLTFSSVERAMYENNISTNGDSNMRDVYLRQLCCHPKISTATRDILDKCKSLDEVKAAMITDNKEKIKTSKAKIISLQKTQKELETKLESNTLASTNEIAECKFKLRNTKSRITRLKKNVEGYEQGLKYFTQIIPKLENCNLDECPVCLCEIEEDDIGMTICGHFYCYESCLKDVIITTGKCALCNRVLGPDEAFQLQKEQIAKKTEKNIELDNLINKFGTKCANLIFDIKNILDNTDEHLIIFSQWDNMLTEIADIFRKHKIKCLPCKGNVYQKNKAIRLFNYSDDYRIILLSTEYSAAGINLTKASTVIFIDPIYGDENYRLSVECQSIGRSARLGQTKPIKILRYLIKESVEEEIFKVSYKTKLDINKLGDIKFVEDV